MYRIDDVCITNFGAKEYPKFTKSLNGDSLFVHGTNNTGKSTTLDGIIYSIFGYRFIDRNANPTDKSEITLSDGEKSFTIKRKYNQKDTLLVQQSRSEVKEYSGHEEIWDQLVKLLDLPEDYTDARLIINALLLPQRTEDAPIRSFSKDQLRSVILTFTSGIETSKKINDLEKEKANHEKQREELRHRKTHLKEEIKDNKFVIYRNKNRLEDLEEFLSIYRSEEIFELWDLLENEPEIREKLNKFHSKRTAAYDKLFSVKRKIGELQRYHDKNLLESAKETLFVLTCPVCNDNIDTDKVETRKRTSHCPFCGRDEYSGELYETLDDRIEFADSEIEELRDQAKQIEEKIERLDDQISQIKEKNSRLEHANSVVVRELENIQDEEQLKDSFQELKKECQQIKQTVNEKKDNVKLTEELLEDTVSKINEHESKINELKEQRVHIEEEVNQENIRQFNKKLDSVYKDLIAPLEHTLYYEDGNLLLDTGHAVKECTNKHTLGFSQRRIVDVALWLTLHQLNHQNEITSLNFALFDDIYENIDNNQVAWKDNLISSLEAFKEDVQLITCSIDKGLNSKINCEITKQLQYQSDLSEFTDQP